MWFHLINLLIYLLFLGCLTAFVATFEFCRQHGEELTAAGKLDYENGGRVAGGVMDGLTTNFTTNDSTANMIDDQDVVEPSCQTNKYFVEV